MRRLAILAVIAWFCCAVAEAAAPPPRGHLVLVGGGDKPHAVMEKFVELAGGTDAAIVVFPTASGQESTGADYLELLRKGHGCRNVVVADVRVRDDAASSELAATVASAGGIFFTGGDQRRITATLLGTPVGDAVRAAFDRGAVVGGTSAGTACQSSLMITGDGDFSVVRAANVELAPGLGLFPGVIVDQHFVARQRQNRLISVVLEHPEMLGVGIDEATAIWVRPDGTFTVIGEGWVMVFDAAGAEVTRRVHDGKVDLGVRALLTHVLLPGEGFDLAARRVVEEVADGR